MWRLSTEEIFVGYEMRWSYGRGRSVHYLFARSVTRFFGLSYFGESMVGYQMSVSGIACGAPGDFGAAVRSALSPLPDSPAQIPLFICAFDLLVHVSVKISEGALFAACPKISCVNITQRPCACLWRTVFQIRVHLVAFSALAWIAITCVYYEELDYTVAALTTGSFRKGSFQK
ncbi:uncharacterized protein BT62DRAFT_562510 [Guyanagaster necrorhizus]|uniref:Uncharacterized protein n=1 Tax=Guyanagaster necrorhizus TaxID=856835 RepID=A0A9P7VGZ1_9AGAR|nr:uncharacterized protein BT62DRAFT_562510 [Guyanagaster necrorhizus MCA 3950]KAG7440836.1 hypothetical protein BT62DRAFT_562510 [Guyanagaster necrorhizus MCA 3950]